MPYSDDWPVDAQGRRAASLGRSHGRRHDDANGCPVVSTETAAILGLVLVLFDWVIRIIALIVIPADRKPTAAMAWLLAIFLIPFIGIVLFLLIGNVKLPKKWRVRQTEVNRLITERSEERCREPRGPEARRRMTRTLASEIPRNAPTSAAVCSS